LTGIHLFRRHLVDLITLINYDRSLKNGPTMNNQLPDFDDEMIEIGEGGLGLWPRSSLKGNPR